MKSIFRTLCAVLLLCALMLTLCAGALAEYPLTLRDQTGREVTLTQAPQRIVSGYYISTSACIALGLTDRMVAVEAKADKRPIYALSAPQLMALPNVGTAKAFDLEACLAAEPELVILPARLADAAQALSEMDVPTLLVEPEDAERLEAMLLLLGEATDTLPRAQELCAFTHAQLDVCAEAVAGQAPVTALVLGNSTYLSCAPGGMYQSSLLSAAGAVNAAADMPGKNWAELSYETLLALNPQALIIPPEAAYTAQDVLGDPELATLDAVQRGAVYAMPIGFEAWDSPVPSGVLGALWVAKTLYPQAVSEATYRDAAQALYTTYYGFAPQEDAL